MSRMARSGSSTADYDDLLIFGYSCKIFADDEKALNVDKGHYLIPWMGNPAMPIDRHDVRGLLSDLSRHEAKVEDADLQYSDYLSPEEALVEEMCDDERYRALHILEEQETRERDEEEAKRQQRAAIGFDYESGNVTQGPGLQDKEETVSDEEMIRQMANFIEKTSEFLARQGAQMEILMRTKESNNPMFQFLNPDNPYHPIYKQVLDIKRQRLKNPAAFDAHPPEVIDVEKSLKILTRNLPSAAPVVPTIKYEAAPPDSAYSRLVEKILENQAAMKSATPSPPPPPAPPAAPEPDGSIVTVPVPPPDLMKLIDQTAYYACKNGNEKLGILRLRQRQQFAFLFPESEFHLYYQYKISLYTEMVEEEAKLKSSSKISSASRKKASSTTASTTTKFPTLKGFFN